MDNQITQPKLTLWQRITTDSGPFWNNVRLIGLLLGGAIAIVAAQLPPAALDAAKVYLAVLAGISSTLVGAAQIAVNNATVLQNPNASLQDVVNAIPVLKQQITDLHGAVVTTVNDALTKGKIDTPASDIPIVTEQPVTAGEALPVAEEVIAAPLTDAFEAAVQLGLKK